MDECQVTVICATYNRAYGLPRMLDALVRQNYDESKWKLIVVDNNSSDNTQEILKSYEDKLPLQILFEPKQGKSHAVNQAFEHLEGWLVVMIDDDIEPYDDWLERMVFAAEENTQYDIFCGQIEPSWETPPPEWVLEWTHHGILYALNGEFQEGEISPHCVWGGNSAFRRKAIPDGQYCRGDLGPRNSVKFPMGNDVSFALKVSETGSKSYHVKAARVRHYISARDLTESWILQRARRYGMGKPYLQPEWFENKSLFMGMPVTTLIKFMVLKMLHPFIYILPKSKKRFNLLWKVYMIEGILIGMAKINKGKGLISRFQPVSDFLD